MSGMFIVLQPITDEIPTAQKPQATIGFLSVMEQHIFILFKDASCLFGNLKRHFFLIFFFTQDQCCGKR